MPDTTTLIAGHVTANGTRKGAFGLRIELRANDGHALAQAFSDMQGGFTLEVAASALAGGGHGQSGLVVKVFNGTAELSSVDLPPGATELALAVDLAPADETNGRAPQAYVVRGSPRQADRQPLAGVVVRAFNQAFRVESPLGVTRSGEDGAYEIAYAPPPAGRGLPRVHLLVKAFPDATEPIESPVRYNAGATETIDLVAPAPKEQPSEYEQLVAKLTPVLGDTPLADLNADDVNFLIADQGLDRERVALLIGAARHAKETGLPAEAIYGLLRQGQPTGLTALVSQPREALAAAIDAAVAANLVPAAVRDTRDATLDRVGDIAAARRLRDPEQPDQPSLGALLDTMALPQAKQERFMGAYLRRAGTIEEFWKALRADPEFGADGTVDTLQLTLQLGQLTDQNVPLVQRLQQARAERSLATLRDFARLDESDWAGLIRAATVDGQPSVPDDVPGETEDEKVANYAAGLASALAVAFPTTYLARQAAKVPQIDMQLARAVLAKYPELDPTQPLPDDLDLAGLGDEDAIKTTMEALRREINSYPEWNYRAAVTPMVLSDAPVANPVRGAVAKFFDNAPDFEFGATTVPHYLAQHGDTALAGIAEELKPAVISQLKNYHCVFPLVTMPEQIDILRGEGISSATQAALTPRKHFISKYGPALGGALEAAKVHERGQGVVAAVHHITNTVQEARQAGSPYVIGGGKPVDPLKDYPDLERLFGSLDTCDCEHCRSVYSAAAYLVDLLHMLETNNSVNKPKPLPLTVLRQRRPDLEYILLTCENTETPLPYADLVNEILESYVANGGLSAATAKNTTGMTAEELSVSPQYVNNKAYDDVLSKVVFPLSLPFDRSVEVARAYLAHMGSSRHEVMRAFQQVPGHGLAVPTNREIAGESLGITPMEWKILTGAPLDPARNLWEFYGYPANAHIWIPSLSVVQKLLDSTGIEYTNLIALVETRFLNPDGKLVLAAKGADCDLDQTTLARQDGSDLTPTLTKLHRLIRLWRKLGWSIPELDAAITALGAGEIDSALLERLAHVERLRDELRLPLVRLLSLWSMIDTHGEGALFRKLFQNKAVQNPPDPIFTLDTDAAELNPLLVQALTPADSPVITLPSLPAPSPQTAQAIAEAFAAAGWPNVESTAVIAEPLTKKLQSLSFSPAQTAEALALLSQQRIAANLPALRAALRVSDAELAAIRADAGLADPRSGGGFALIAHGSVLSLQNLSRMYRYTVLAKGLRLAIADLIALKALSGIDPFDEPAQTASFVEIARTVKSSGFAIPELSYLFRHVVAPSGAPAPKPEDVDQLLATLGDGLLAIGAEHRPATDPSGDLLRAKLALILDAGMVETAMALVEGTLSDSADQIERTITDLGFDKILGSIETARLLVGAALAQTDDASDNASAKQDRRDRVLAAMLPYLRDRLSRGLIKQTLSEALQLDPKVAAVLLEQVLDSRAVPQAPLVADFLALAPDGLLGVYASVPMSPQRTPIARVAPTLSFAWGRQLPAPELRALVSEWSGQIAPAGSGAYSFLLHTDKPVVVTIGSKTLTLEENTGRNRRLFNLRGTLELDAGRIYPVKVTPRDEGQSISPDLRWASPGKPLVAIDLAAAWSARWAGKLLAQRSEEYTFVVRTDDAQVKIALGDQPLALTADVPADKGLFTLRGTAPLEAGQLYALDVQYATTGTNAAIELRWSSPSTPLQVVPQRQLYARTDFTLDQPQDACALLHKAALLAGGFQLTAAELAHLAAHPDDFAGFDLNQLPLEAAQADQAPALFGWWLRLAGFVALRDSLPQSDTELIDVFAVAAKEHRLSEGFPEDIADAALAVTGWDKAAFDELVGPDGFGLLGKTFRDEIWLLRLQACLDLSRRLGVAPRKLFDWAKATLPAEQAQAIILSAKARYDEETWLAAAKPVSDGLRERQRDALIAYVMHQTGRRDSNQLFEYFLIDVNMSACMVTSRIKQAIASVQLFVQRCLMNLEEGVAPDAIDAGEWRNWRQRYRVWEANRKVFLYPENWIEPELRDDKSPFFKELETELLQNDLTNDSAEQALMNYLHKLDEVARLEVCGLYVEEKEKGGLYKGDPATIHHIFARTYSTPRIYYYRRLIKDNEGLELWTPWERVNVDIEGDHLLPFVYNRRLYLFWLIFNEKAETQQNSKGHTSAQPVKRWEIKLAWSEYRQNRWSNKHTSSGSISSRSIETVLELQSKKEIKREESDLKDDKFILEEDTKTIIPINTAEGFVEYITSIIVEMRTEGSTIPGPQENQNTNIIQHFKITSIEEFFVEYYLPQTQQHFFAATFDSGNLIIKIYRRFSGGLFLKYHERHETPGFFSLDTGKNEVKVIPATDDFAFEDLVRPQDSTNAFMGFEGSTAKLAFSAEKAILDIIPNTPYNLLYSHQDGDFKLMGSFFYQDKQQTYAVLPIAEEVPTYNPVLKDVDFYPKTLYKQDQTIEDLRTSLKELVINPWWRALTTNPVVEPVVVDDDITGPIITSGMTGPIVTGNTLMGGNGTPTPMILTSDALGATSAGLSYGTSSTGNKIAQAGAAMRTVTKLRFITFYHPYVNDFIQALNKDGIPGLLTLRNQEFPHQQLPPSLDFGMYAPNDDYVSKPYPKEEVEFEQGAYALYNWELFFHIPLLIATRLSQQQRFAEAQRWFHYIFDPTTSSNAAVPNRYWNVRPFHDNYQTQQEQIASLLAALTTGATGPPPAVVQQIQKNVRRQISEWQRDPFKPHLLARMRKTAYQKTVVMKYIDNLIAWGDQLFRQDTIEAINEATQLYVLAGDILGQRPQRIPPRGTVEPKSYHQLPHPLGDFSLPLVEFETLLPLADQTTLAERSNAASAKNKYKFGKLTTPTPTLSDVPSGSHTLAAETRTLAAGGNLEGSLANKGNGAIAELQAAATYRPSDGTGSWVSALSDMLTALTAPVKTAPGTAFYFGIPQNDKLLGYWDTVADRLFKIRNCMNIEGVVRQLPLFEPPIDPAMLVRAAAAGVDLNSVLNDMSAPLPHYRFGYLAQKALELAAEVRSLGAALLAALEKKDAEALSTLRAGHETAMLKLLKAVKVKQVEEANINRQALEKTKAVTEERYTFYKNITPIIEQEQTHLNELAEAQKLQSDAQSDSISASEVMRDTPDFNAGVQLGINGGPTFSTTLGRGNILARWQTKSQEKNAKASHHTYAGTLASTMGAWKRREEEWKLQERLAARELAQIEQQIVAAEIRIEIANTDLSNHEQQIENAQAVEEFLRDKYTNEELYAWMTGEIAAVFFQSYKLAYDMAKRAERTYQFERGLTSSNFIQFGYWDSLRKGLLSGERLYLDLKRLEIAYLDQNRREYELTRQISLLQLDPMALIELKEIGKCEIDLPEALFDLDYPGHYMRRIKSVSLTIPCVSGPYTGVNCTLTLLKNKVRVNATGATPYEQQEDVEDARFVTSWGAVQSIATSHAQNDSGLFELNFRDERYLPFEGAGAVSTWRISMPPECNAFDFDTITDVVMKISYTAREGGAMLAKAAHDAAMQPAEPAELTRLFSAKHEFPTEWYQFLHPTPSTATPTLSVQLARERFPFRVRSREITIDTIEMLLNRKPNDEAGSNQTQFQIASLRCKGNQDSELVEMLPTKPNTPAPAPVVAVPLDPDPALKNMPHAQPIAINKSAPLACEMTVAGAAPEALVKEIDDLLIVVHYSVD